MKLKLILGACLGLLLGGHVNAAVITVGFSLDPALVFDPGSNAFVATGPALTGTFDISDDVGDIMTTTVPGPTVNCPNCPVTFHYTNVLGINIDLAPFLIDGSSVLTSLLAAPQAIVHLASGTSVYGGIIGLHGEGSVTGTDSVVRALVLTVDPLSGASSATFTADPGGTSTVVTSYSGAQVIPEPSVVALTGAGLLAFGIAGIRRRKQTQIL